MESLSHKRYIRIEVLEYFQKRATKLVKVYKKLPYEQRLNSLGIYILLCHHQSGDLTEVFKILKGYHDTSFLHHLMLPAQEVTA